jgi:hypothetical protein
LDPQVQQQRIVQAFKEYMQAYTAWEAGGFGNNSLLKAAEDKRTVMMTAVDQLYSNPNYYPPEVPCP